MDIREKALQAAMAAEIRARLGRMNQTQKWLAKESGVSDSAWRKYFTEGAIQRDVPTGKVFRIAEVLGMSASELMAAAEKGVPETAARMLGLTEAERADLLESIAETRRVDPLEPGSQSTNGHRRAQGDN